MKLQYLPVLLVLLALCGASSAVTPGESPSADAYCHQQITPCVKQCCPALQGTWDESQQDCIYSGSEDETLQDMLNGPCGSCAQQAIDCYSNYQEPTQPTIPTPEPSSPGCCGSIIAILAITAGAVFARR